jgi:hypothetical protein
MNLSSAFPKAAKLLVGMEMEGLSLRSATRVAHAHSYTQTLVSINLSIYCKWFAALPRSVVIFESFVATVHVFH